MKKILSVLVLNILMFASVSSGTTHASYSLDWDNLEISYEYDSGRDELEIELRLDNVDARPSEDFKVQLEVDNTDHDRLMTYSSSRDELYAIFRFDNIDSNDFSEDYRDLVITIRDEDNYRVFDRDVRLTSLSSSHGGNLDWDKLKTTFEYSESRERLHIKFFLEDIDENPEDDYKVYIETNNTELSARMYYSSSQDELTGNIYISGVEKNEVEDYYNIEVTVKDSEDTLYTDDIRLSNSVDTSSTLTLDNWEYLEYSIGYEKSRNKLHFQLKLDNVPYRAERLSNSGRYTAEAIVDGKRYNLVFDYEPSDNSLRAYESLSIFSESRVKLSYNVRLKIEDNAEEVFNEIVRIKTDKNAPAPSFTTSPSNETSSHNNSTTTNISSQDRSKAEILANRFILRIEREYASESQRLLVLKQLVNVLERARFSYSNKAYLDAIIDTLKEEINSYSSESNSSHNNSTSTGKTRTFKQPGAIESDGTGGTYKTYGGYNN